MFKVRDRRGAEKINQWNTAMLIHDARMLIEYVLKKDKDVIAELLTTSEYFIAHPVTTSMPESITIRESRRSGPRLRRSPHRVTKTDKGGFQF